MPVDGSHNVTLDYFQDPSGNDRVRQPATIVARKGDLIVFLRGSIPPGKTLAVLFDEPHFFSRPTFDENETAVEVKVDLPHRTTYRCGLKLNGHLIESSVSGPADGGGGDIDPPSLDGGV